MREFIRREFHDVSQRELLRIVLDRLIDDARLNAIERGHVTIEKRKLPSNGDEFLLDLARQNERINRLLILHDDLRVQCYCLKAVTPRGHFPAG